MIVVSIADFPHTFIVPIVDFGQLFFLFAVNKVCFAALRIVNQLINIVG